MCSVCLSAATAVLVVASTEVDKSGASYYGEQTLHYVGASGESAVVQLREYPCSPCNLLSCPCCPAASAGFLCHELIFKQNPPDKKSFTFFFLFRSVLLLQEMLLFSGLPWGFFSVAEFCYLC